jgi:putative ABC transport system permease protein
MIAHYLSTALRHFRRHKLTAAINVTGLALGFTCFIAAFAAVSYVDSSDAGFATADRAYAITQRIRLPAQRLDTGALPATSPSLAGVLQADLPELEAVARADRLGELDMIAGNTSNRLATVAVDNDFLRIFPFAMTPDSRADALTRPRSAVLTREGARRLFGTEDVVGKTVTLQQSIDVTIAGVIEKIDAPSQFDDSSLGYLRFDLLVTWDVAEHFEELAGNKPFEQLPAARRWSQQSSPTYVLLPRGMSREVLDRTLAGIVERHYPSDLRAVAEHRFAAVPASRIWQADIDALVARGDISLTLVVRMLAILVLVTACLNCSNLAAAESIGRLNEAGVRRVLGASSGQVIAQNVVQVAVLGVAGLLLSLCALAALAPSLYAKSSIDLVAAVLTDGRVPLVTLASLVAVIVLAALYPALILARAPAAGAMKQKSRGESLLASRVLVAVQFGVASLLSIAIIVVALQGRELRTHALGASAAQTLVIRNGAFDLPMSFEALRDRLQQVPGVESVAVIDSVPWSNDTNSTALSRGVGATDPFVTPLEHSVTPGFEASLGLKLLAGRSFDASYGDDFFPKQMPAGMTETDPSRVYSVILDEDLARELGWDRPEAAVGQIAYMPFHRIGLRDITVRVIGVVEHKPLRLTGTGTYNNVFVSARAVQGYPILRVSTANVASTIDALGRVWKDIEPRAPFATRFLDEYFERSYAMFERLGRIVSGVTAFAFVICLMGLVGMAMFVADRRRHEIGVRKTLGASVTRILSMLLRDFARPLVIANIAVWPLAYLAANAYLSVFAQRMTLTPLPFLASLALIVIIAWLAVGGHAWRAAMRKPAETLRYE